MENDLKSYQNTVTEKNVELIRLNRRVVELEESNEKYISRNTILEEQNKVVDEIKDNLQKQLKKNDVSSFNLYLLVYISVYMCTKEINL